MATRYLTGFIGETDLRERNHTEALRRGCFRDPLRDITRYWWAMERHPERDEWAMKIPEGDEGGLDARERGELKDETVARGDGWRAGRNVDDEIEPRTR